MGESCVCYEGGASVRHLPCQHMLCIDCGRRLRQSICPMCRASLEDMMLEMRIAKCIPTGPYSFHFTVPFVKRNCQIAGFAADYYPSGSGRDFEVSISPDALQSVIMNLNKEIHRGASSESTCLDSCFPSCLRSAFVRHRTSASIRQQNRAWSAAGIPCRLILTPGWMLEHSSLYVDWDPD